MTQIGFLPDIILGVWISTKPFLMRVSLKSWHTPDCRRKTAWLVVVFGRKHTQLKHWATSREAITTLGVIHWIHYTIITDVQKQDCQFVFFFSLTCTFCLLQGWNINLLAKARPAFRPRKSLGNLKPIIINVKAESWEGSQLLQVNPEITVKI